jgi:hypothetical protein
MTLNETEKRIVELTKQLVMTKVERLPEHPLGHAYLWANITLRRAQKNGKVKTFVVKTCLGGICCADLVEAVRLAQSVPDVNHVYYNLD